jgi:hypothetical protein
VECTWNEAFRILALVEHQNWGDTNSDANPISINLVPGVDPPPSTLPKSPESREFVILIFEAHSPPIRCKNDVDLVYLIPIIGSPSAVKSVSLVGGLAMRILQVQCRVHSSCASAPCVHIN